ncbi:hypothetical protein [Paenibacillus puerhi]|uniref:hypothetical protein n=1 Tax=Paenibacillus puerhi TaxID=2692622 RepID=UPI0013570585|nr:hypothetical protein [Paenibacillus puerhi]
MKSAHARKVIISTLALTLLFGGGALCVNNFANAEDNPAAVPSTGSGGAPEDSANQASPKSWFGKGERKDKSPKSEGGRQGERAERHSGHSSLVEEASGVLGISQDELKKSLEDKTLVELAKERGMSEADLVAKLKAVRIAQLDQAVAAGKLTADQAARMKEKLDNHLSFLVNQHLNKLGKHRGGGHKSRMLPAQDKLADIIGISESELKSQLNEGKSLTEIAEAKGMSKDQLIAKIKDELTPWIEKAVDRKPSKKEK